MISEKLEKIYVSCYAFMYCIIENYVHKFVNNAIVSIYLPDGNYVDVNYKWRTRIPKDTFVIFNKDSKLLSLGTYYIIGYYGEHLDRLNLCGNIFVDTPSEFNADKIYCKSKDDNIIYKYSKNNNNTDADKRMCLPVIDPSKSLKFADNSISIADDIKELYFSKNAINILARNFYSNFLAHSQIVIDTMEQTDMLKKFFKSANHIPYGRREYDTLDKTVAFKGYKVSTPNQFDHSILTPRPDCDCFSTFSYSSIVIRAEEQNLLCVLDSFADEDIENISNSFGVLVDNWLINTNNGNLLKYCFDYNSTLHQITFPTELNGIKVKKSPKVHFSVGQ